jgi:hypothetical protein
MKHQRPNLYDKEHPEQSPVIANHEGEWGAVDVQIWYFLSLTSLFLLSEKRYIISLRKKLKISKIKYSIF